MCALAAVAHSSPAVDRVQQADDEGRYADVLRDVQAIETKGLSVEERVTVLRLEASAHAAFGDEAAAVLAFRRLLALDPNFVHPENVSPKLRRYLDAARAAGPIADSQRTLVPPRLIETQKPIGGLQTAVPQENSRAWYRSGWAWGAVGVVAAGTIAVFVWRGTNDSASPNLGEIALP